jgi:hypothetical protein
MVMEHQQAGYLNGMVQSLNKFGKNNILDNNLVLKLSPLVMLIMMVKTNFV